MSTWSSGIGKFVKKDPNHGIWWRKIKHWLCKVGLCNLDSCTCDCHKDEFIKDEYGRIHKLKKECCKKNGCKCKKQLYFLYMATKTNYKYEGEKVRKKTRQGAGNRSKGMKKYRGQGRQ